MSFPTPSGLRIVRGDATDPQAFGPKIIAYVCNDRGGWGKGFVLALSRRWSEPERDYRAWYRERARNDFALGAVRLVPVGTGTWVANMVAQHGVRRGSGGPPIRYEAVSACLRALAGHARELGATVHMPRIGCGLAGGRWERIQPLVEAGLLGRGVEVTVYDTD
ncbi:O-acetyl-ADP-ribose deacetylase (regulator of RNase III) [Nocardiopsis arvandica]|uniref:O-acetyl-ADP-ribose deacetylase (Regulator of RNase III) n=1 Tax=Nocardiopsis sinuspersici TaxID=501010 RepID=A0A7Y9XG35_9ACTN|nr:macro domain-containing protein [Nocardiopsis sinuspersici]NYH55222.1 O-acetyl-ADP-ribose deacetylase (regulator of RNase III) [Nocardiopsis sinuspersici]